MNFTTFKIASPLIAIGITCGNFLGIAAYAGVRDTGEKGAQIYCYMRESGNDHEVSWTASYEVIKRQANSLFKTSPKHAAVMIIEAVVQNPGDYEDCGNYLGDLFGNNKNNILIEGKSKDGNEFKPSKERNNDRYSY